MDGALSTRPENTSITKQLQFSMLKRMQIKKDFLKYKITMEPKPQHFGYETLLYLWFIFAD